MLIIQIALGIVLGFLILAYLPQILKVCGWGIFLVLVLAGLALAIYFIKDILMFAFAIFGLFFFFLGAIPIYILNKERVGRFITDFRDGKSPVLAIFILAIPNAFLAFFVYELTGLSSLVYDWSFKVGLKDSLGLFTASVFSLWPWLLIISSKDKTQKVFQELLLLFKQEV